MSSLPSVTFSKTKTYAVGGGCEEYQLPYYDMLPNDPTIEEVRKVVCTNKQRPVIPNKWQSCEVSLDMLLIAASVWIIIV